jgi:hypothetical protein
MTVSPAPARPDTTDLSAYPGGEDDPKSRIGPSNLRATVGDQSDSTATCLRSGLIRRRQAADQRPGLVVMNGTSETTGRPDRTFHSDVRRRPALEILPFATASLFSPDYATPLLPFAHL